MSIPCENQWRRRAAAAPFSASVAFFSDALVFGQGTVLRRLDESDPDTVSLHADAAHDRMVALLAVAGHGRLAERALLQLEAAVDDWMRGDRGVAAIRLAFAPLPRLRDRDDAYRLFLAETALDVGVRPNVLLRHLDYAACMPLLKFDPAQPRVPAGSGARSGQWTSGTTSGDEPPSRRASNRPEPGLGEAGAPTLTPVFLDVQPDGEDEVIHDKERRGGFGETPQERIEDGWVLRPPIPGGRIGPALPGAPDGAGVASPDIGAKPVPLPKPAPGGGDPPPNDAQPPRDEGPACPARQDDVKNGSNYNGDETEYSMSLHINPENPTPKQSAATPDVTSQAYFLPSDTFSGRISFDDCKESDTPTDLLIPGLRRGDLFELKATEWGWVISSPSIKGYGQFERQVENQNAAVVAEGKGRQIYYCLGNQVAVSRAENIVGDKYKNSHFLVCR